MKLGESRFGHRRRILVSGRNVGLDKQQVSVGLTAFSIIQGTEFLEMLMFL